MVNLDYRDARPIYAQIIDTYRGQIGAGILLNGDKLPSSRKRMLCLRNSRRSGTGTAGSAAAI